MKILRGSTSKTRIANIFVVRQFEEVERSGFYTEVEGVSAARGLPIHAHFPTMEVAVEAEIGVRELFVNKIVADVADGDAPFF